MTAAEQQRRLRFGPDARGPPARKRHPEGGQHQVLGGCPIYESRAADSSERVEASARVRVNYRLGWPHFGL
jgi:hypothetical protein